jgi:hypothetical protein
MICVEIACAARVMVRTSISPGRRRRAGTARSLLAAAGSRPGLGDRAPALVGVARVGLVEARQPIASACEVQPGRERRGQGLVVHGAAVARQHHRPFV